MRCSDFLHHYSEYRDGLIVDPGRLRAVRAHLAHCPRCMRYDARVARGALLLRAASDLEPSPLFRRRLRRRLAAAPAELHPATPARASVIAALMLAAALALFAWEANGRLGDEATGAPAIPRTVPAVLARPGVPFVSFTDLSVPAFGSEWRASRATLLRAASWPGLVP